jgi:hypothetical protein
MADVEITIQVTIITTEPIITIIPEPEQHVLIWDMPLQEQEAIPILDQILPLDQEPGIIQRLVLTPQ